MGNDSKQLMTRAIACGSALPSSLPHHAEAVPQAVLTGNIPVASKEGHIPQPPCVLLVHPQPSETKDVTMVLH